MFITSQPCYKPVYNFTTLPQACIEDVHNFSLVTSLIYKPCWMQYGCLNLVVLTYARCKPECVSILYPLSGPLRGLLGPGEVLILGPLVYLSLYILCHVMLYESLSFVTKGGRGYSPRKKFLKLKMV